DLPSPLTALVTMIVRAPRSRFANSMFVRSIRNDSAWSPVGSWSITRRGGEPGEERQPEPVGKRLCGAHPCVERVPEERDPDTHDDPEDEPEREALERLRLDLHRVLGLAAEEGVRGLQRLHRPELLVLV